MRVLFCSSKSECQLASPLLSYKFSLSFFFEVPLLAKTAKLTAASCSGWPKVFVFYSFSCGIINNVYMLMFASEGACLPSLPMDIAYAELYLKRLQSFIKMSSGKL